MKFEKEFKKSKFVGFTFAISGLAIQQRWEILTNQLSNFDVLPGISRVSPFLVTPLLHQLPALLLLYSLRGLLKEIVCLHNVHTFHLEENMGKKNRYDSILPGDERTRYWYDISEHDIGMTY